MIALGRRGVEFGLRIGKRDTGDKDGKSRNKGNEKRSGRVEIPNIFLPTFLVISVSYQIL